MKSHREEKIQQTESILHILQPFTFGELVLKQRKGNYDNYSSFHLIFFLNCTPDCFCAYKVQKGTHLEADTAAIKTALVHGGVLPKKELAETVLVLEEEVAVTVVVEQPLSEVDQSPQLAQSTAVSFHICGLMGCTEKDAPSVGCDVTCLVDDVKKTAAYHLYGNRKQKSIKA